MTRPYASFRDSVVAKISDFLEKAGFRDQLHAAELSSLIDRLKGYREEGKSLTPQIYFLGESDLLTFKKTLPGFEFIQFGDCEGEEKVCRVALKKGAPLAQNGWHILILLMGQGKFKFGVFRQNESLIALPVDDLLSGVDSFFKFIVLKQVGLQALSLHGCSDCSLHIHYSTTLDPALTDVTHVGNLCRLIATDVSKNFEDLAEVEGHFTRVLQKVFTDAGNEGHGFLVAVVPSCDAPGLKSGDFKDGQFLEPAVEIFERVRLCHSEKSLQPHFNLEAAVYLVKGMLCTDGITLFDTQGRVLGFNIFVKPVGEAQNSIGGARKRTFSLLAELVSQGQLAGAFMRSQDGECEFQKGGQ